MVRFYLSLLGAALKVFEKTWASVSFWVGFILLTVVGLLAPGSSSQFPQLGWWVIAPLVVVFLFAILKANYDRLRLQEQHTESLAQQLERHEERQGAVNELARLRNDGVQIYAEQISGPVQLVDWYKKVEAWRDSVKAHLAAHFTEAIQLNFDAIGELPSKTFKHQVDAMHSTWLAALVYRLDMLKKITEQNTATFR